MNKDSLGDRMKDYENISRNYLTKRIPVIIRLDGKAFHTFTRGMKKPFDEILMSAMQETMKRLCESIQGCVFGYTQSDEITLVLTDYEKITTDSWFGYNIQKMASVSASMATMIFNKEFTERVDVFLANLHECWHTSEEEDRYADTLVRAIEKGALFDSRVFTIPKEEVCNCLIWRQQDATRNSIESAGHAYFNTKALYKKTCNEIQEMLFQEKGINWNDYRTDFKRGCACYKISEETEMVNPKDKNNIIKVIRNRWTIDKEIPVFTKDRNFVEKWL